MRCLLLPVMMLSGCTAFLTPVAPARPQQIVRAEPPKTEAVAKKKGIPLALLIWPLIAVGDDVRAQCRSFRTRRHRRAERTHRQCMVDLRPQIYVSQVQPRLAEQGIETPALPYSNTNYLKK